MCVAQPLAGGVSAESAAVLVSPALKKGVTRLMYDRFLLACRPRVADALRPLVSILRLETTEQLHSIDALQGWVQHAAAFVNAKPGPGLSFADVDHGALPAMLRRSSCVPWTEAD